MPDASRGDVVSSLEEVWLISSIGPLRKFVSQESLKHLYVLSRKQPPDWEVRSFCMALFTILTPDTGDDQSYDALLPSIASVINDSRMLPLYPSLPVKPSVLGVLKAHDRSSRLIAQLSRTANGITLLVTGVMASMLQLVHSPSQQARVNCLLSIAACGLAHPSHTADAIAGLTGIPDLRGCVTGPGRLDYGPFNKHSPHHVPGSKDNDPMPTPVYHKEMHMEEQAAVLAMLCSLGAAVSGRLLLTDRFTFDLLIGLADAVLVRVGAPGSNAASYVAPPPPQANGDGKDAPSPHGPGGASFSKLGPLTNAAHGSRFKFSRSPTTRRFRSVPPTAKAAVAVVSTPVEPSVPKEDVHPMSGASVDWASREWVDGNGVAIHVCGDFCNRTIAADPNVTQGTPGKPKRAFRAADCASMVAFTLWAYTCAKYVEVPQRKLAVSSPSRTSNVAGSPTGDDAFTTALMSPGSSGKLSARGKPLKVTIPDDKAVRAIPPPPNTNFLLSPRHLVPPASSMVQIFTVIKQLLALPEAETFSSVMGTLAQMVVHREAAGACTC